MATIPGGLGSGELAPDSGLQRGTNWWGAFVIGLAGTILVTGVAPFAVQSLGAASIPLFVAITSMGVVLCFCLAELAAMMPERTGGLPSYAFETFKPLGHTTAKHVGGVSGWAYWLGWFPVAPINMILASNYIVSLFNVPTGRTFLPFGTLGTEVSMAVLIISLLGLLAMFVPALLGIRLGAGFATLLGVVSMVPLTLLVLLPVFNPSSMDPSNLSGFSLPPGTDGSLAFFVSWIFIMTWSVLAMEAAACYIGECREPARDAKIAMTAEGLFGLFIYIMIPLMFVLVLGVAEELDPLTVFTDFAVSVFGTSGDWVRYVIGLPLIVALLLSVLNAIMGVGRSLYQVAEDGLLPRWFQHLNRHGVPDHAMTFNVVCSAIVVLFGSPLRIYVFSNMGYLLACALALGGYFLHRHLRPDVARPVRMHGALRWVALAIFVFFMFVWAYGGWHAPKLVVGPEEGSFLFFLGLAVIAAYLPLYLWRRESDRRAGQVEAAPARTGPTRPD
ncbi:MAG: APC family permease [Actinomycetota bacterium]|nr:APC family permease [Actinomycetota bacterium]